MERNERTDRKNIIAQTGADSFRIERKTPYSNDYTTLAYGEAQEEAQNNARPAIKNPLKSIAQYDKIVLCYPIWWHTAPMTVGTFLQAYDFTAKPFIRFPSRHPWIHHSSGSLLHL